MILNYSQPLEVTNLTSWLDSALRSSMSEFWVLLIEFVIVGALLLTAYAVIALILIYAERKITAFFQARFGPNRVGKWGLLQSVADMIKILLKEIVKINRCGQSAGKTPVNNFGESSETVRQKLYSKE